MKFGLQGDRLIDDDVIIRLIDFNLRIDALDEHVRGIEADGARQQPERENNQRCVAKVQQSWNEISDFCFIVLLIILWSLILYFFV